VNAVTAVEPVIVPEQETAAVVETVLVSRAK
jgi:hypothetical protein